MTRLAILADLHGNLPALDAVIDDMASFDVDHVIVAGDVVNRGPFNAQVVERVLAERWAVIRGNNEFYLLDYKAARAPGEWTLPRWLHKQLSGRLQAQIAAWPDTLSLRYPDGPPIRVVHGSPRDLSRGFIHADWPDDAALAEILADVDEPLVVCAHTHLTLDRQVGRWRVLNPGAVGMPFDGCRDASYMLLDSDGAGWEPTFRRVPYDYARVLREYERQGFIAQCGYVARIIVEEFDIALPLYWSFHQWFKKNYLDGTPTVEAVEQFLGDNWRDYLLHEYRFDFDLANNGCGQ